MDIRPPNPIQFRTDPLFRVHNDPRTRESLTIEWQIAALAEIDPKAARQYGSLSTFLYWAQAYGATYGVFDAALQRTLRGRISWELQCITGGFGTYLRDVIADWSGVYRLFPSTHALTQHGLDGMPARFVEELRRTIPHRPIFRVELPDGGLFGMSLSAWEGYARSGRDSADLADLGVTIETSDDAPGPLQRGLWT